MALSRYYSDADIRRILGDRAVIMLYRDLYMYETIDDLLDAGNGAAIILYEQTSGVGHWTAVVEGTGRQEGVIFAFDSYGLPIDEPLTEIDPKFRMKSFQDYGYLSMLLGSAPDGVEIDYNDYELQGAGENIATCGPWSIARVLNPHLSSEEFAILFTPGEDENFTPDELVAAFVESLPGASV
jgi:hypothetical protein